ncbi:MAG: FAD-binding oxidoreductase [Candidatus Nanopelagicales bacterium]|nr:FAD-binding oxidoreductase [Candidatus Nanopelagicales bacterium]MDZ4248893.1 FAD-binding oxidoreductase [Candidatus Nanopelagicales bacterium]
MDGDGLLAQGDPAAADGRFAQAADSASRGLASIPDEARVRVAKKTSNLFRGRSAGAHELDLSEFSSVYSVDSENRTATVGGLTTYEDLVAATLPHGLVPLCVPQLRTITLGGAVTGLGIEAASFRNGCPHESVLSMDVLTGDGTIVHARPDGRYSDLFHGFPNSYGTLGYALRLVIELEPAPGFVSLRHVPFSSAADVAAAIAAIARDGLWDGERVDYVDGTVFAPDETYLTLGQYADVANSPVSDYRGMRIYYKSIQQRSSDILTVNDFLWRWDTDWFWCSRPFGVQNPVIRRLWPKSRLRSDVYWRIVAWDRRFGLSARADRLRGRSAREPVVQDVEVPVDALPEFMDFFHREVGITPVWLCPLRQRDPAARWPLYQFDPDTTYVNVGFWSTVPVPEGVEAESGTINRRIEAEVTRLGGRKSLYSTSFYPRDEFYRIYGKDQYWNLKHKYDPGGRFAELYDKCVGGGRVPGPEPAA